MALEHFCENHKNFSNANDEHWQDKNGKQKYGCLKCHQDLYLLSSNSLSMLLKQVRQQEKFILKLLGEIRESV